MSAPLRLQPLSRPLDGAVRVPGSKSITNRALLCAALAPGRSVLKGALFSDDSRHMAQCLRDLGFAVEEDPAALSLAVSGLGGRLPADSPAARGEKDLFVGNAGTAARFLPCLVGLGRAGSFRFDGEPRLRERPMGPLFEVLRAQGSRLEAPQGGEARGYPFTQSPAGLAGGSLSIDLSDSSQFASGLLMAAPYAERDLQLKAAGDRQQLPYVDMTAAVMEQFGVRVKAEPGRYTVAAGQRYSPRPDYRVEPDLSGAAYFFAAPALAGGRVKVLGTSNASIQGDLRFLKVLQHLGIRFYQEEDGLLAERFPQDPLKGGVTVDMNAFSDQALTLAALAPFASGPVKIVNVAHIRRQECDRIHAMAFNLRALGVELREFEDGVEIQPWPESRRRGALIRCFGDHRVAMAFSLLGLAVPGVEIDDPACVSKTFAGYWKTWEALRGDGHAA